MAEAESLANERDSLVAALEDSNLTIARLEESAAAQAQRGAEAEQAASDAQARFADDLAACQAEADAAKVRSCGAGAEAGLRSTDWREGLRGCLVAVLRIIIYLYEVGFFFFFFF